MLFVSTPRHLLTSLLIGLILSPSGTVLGIRPGDESLVCGDGFCIPEPAYVATLSAPERALYVGASARGYARIAQAFSTARTGVSVASHAFPGIRGVAASLGLMSSLASSRSSQLGAEAHARVRLLIREARQELASPWTVTGTGHEFSNRLVQRFQSNNRRIQDLWNLMRRSLRPEDVAEMSDAIRNLDLANQERVMEVMFDALSGSASGSNSGEVVRDAVAASVAEGSAQSAPQTQAALVAQETRMQELQRKVNLTPAEREELERLVGPGAPSGALDVRLSEINAFNTYGQIAAQVLSVTGDVENGQRLSVVVNAFTQIATAATLLSSVGQGAASGAAAAGYYGAIIGAVVSLVAYAQSNGGAGRSGLERAFRAISRQIEHVHETMISRFDRLESLLLESHMQLLEEFGKLHRSNARIESRLVSLQTQVSAVFDQVTRGAIHSQILDARNFIDSNFQTVFRDCFEEVQTQRAFETCSARYLSLFRNDIMSPRLSEVWAHPIQFEEHPDLQIRKIAEMLSLSSNQVQALPNAPLFFNVLMRFAHFRSKNRSAWVRDFDRANPIRDIVENRMRALEVFRTSIDRTKIERVISEINASLARIDSVFREKLERKYHEKYLQPQIDILRRARHTMEGAVAGSRLSRRISSPLTNLDTFFERLETRYLTNLARSSSFYSSRLRTFEEEDTAPSAQLLYSYNPHFPSVIPVELKINNESPALMPYPAERLASAFGPVFNNGAYLLGHLSGGKVKAQHTEGQFRILRKRQAFSALSTSTGPGNSPSDRAAADRSRDRLNEMMVRLRALFSSHSRGLVPRFADHGSRGNLKRDFTLSHAISEIRVTAQGLMPIGNSEISPTIHPVIFLNQQRTNTNGCARVADIESDRRPRTRAIPLDARGNRVRHPVWWMWWNEASERLSFWSFIRNSFLSALAEGEGVVRSYDHGIGSFGQCGELFPWNRDPDAFNPATSVGGARMARAYRDFETYSEGAIVRDFTALKQEAIEEVISEMRNSSSELGALYLDVRSKLNLLRALVAFYSGHEVMLNEKLSSVLRNATMLLESEGQFFFELAGRATTRFLTDDERSNDRWLTSAMTLHLNRLIDELPRSVMPWPEASAYLSVLSTIEQRAP